MWTIFSFHYLKFRDVFNGAMILSRIAILHALSASHTQRLGNLSDVKHILFCSSLQNGTLFVFHC